MGNRAVITFSNHHAHAPCIYLHWNGGRASVEGFLAAARALSIRATSDTIAEHTRTMDAIAQTLAQSFFGCNVGFTVYREKYMVADTDNGDNGTYRIDNDLNIVGRDFTRGRSEECSPAKTAGIVEQILARAPIFND